MKGESVMKYMLNWEMLVDYEEVLVEEEKSQATIEKYMRDVRKFFQYVEETESQENITKEIVLSYKRSLIEKYAPVSVNSMLASLNHFFKINNWYECIVKSLKIQRRTFRDRERELTKQEYYQLLQAAQRKGKYRLYCILQTICGSGIRVSELKYITVRAVERKRAVIFMKNKTRTILLPSKLCCLLKEYCRKEKITSGTIFITKRGKPLDRSNIFHEMKKLCEVAGVEKEKVFPHNLRHLFAYTYYKAEKDVVHLADILGHSSVDTTRIYTMGSGEEEMRQLSTLGLIVQCG